MEPKPVSRHAHRCETEFLLAHCSPSFMTSSTNCVISWSLAPATTCDACAPKTTRGHSCSMTTPRCTSAGAAVCWRPHRRVGKVSLIAELCKPSPRGTRSCTEEKDDVPPSTTGGRHALAPAQSLPRLWRDVWKQFCPDIAPLLLEQYCCSHFPGTDDGAALGRTRFGALEKTVREFQPFLAIGEMRAALLRLASYVLAEIGVRCIPIGVQCIPLHWVFAQTMCVVG